MFNSKRKRENSTEKNEPQAKISNVSGIPSQTTDLTDASSEQNESLCERLDRCEREVNALKALLQMASSKGDMAQINHQYWNNQTATRITNLQGEIRSLQKENRELHDAVEKMKKQIAQLKKAESKQQKYIAAPTQTPPVKPRQQPTYFSAARPSTLSYYPPPTNQNQVATPQPYTAQDFYQNSGFTESTGGPAPASYTSLIATPQFGPYSRPPLPPSSDTRAPQNPYVPIGSHPASHFYSNTQPQQSTQSNLQPQLRLFSSNIAPRSATN